MAKFQFIKAIIIQINIEIFYSMSNNTQTQINHKNTKQASVQLTKNTKKQSLKYKQTQYEMNKKQMQTQTRGQHLIQKQLKYKQSNNERESQIILKNGIKNKMKTHQSNINRQMNKKSLESMDSEGIFNQMQQNKKKKKKRNDRLGHKSKNSNKQFTGSLDHININNLIQDQSYLQIQRKEQLKRKSTKKNHIYHIIKQKNAQQDTLRKQAPKKVENKQIKATKQLIDQQNSIQLQQNNDNTNQKLQGWVIKTKTSFYPNNDQSIRNNHSSPSTSPLSKKQLFNNKTNKQHIYFSPQNFHKDNSSKLLSKNSRNTLISRPGSKNKNSQITTSQFLKQLKLKYAKIAQQKHQKDRRNIYHTRIHSQDHNQSGFASINNHTRNKTQEVLTEQESKYKNAINYEQNCQCNYCLVNINSIKDDNAQKFFKYQEKRQIPRQNLGNVQQKLKNLKRKIQKTNQEIVQGEYFGERINHDGLYPGSESRSKSRIMKFNTNMKNGEGNQQEQRNLTIDPSQLQFSRIHINQYINGQSKKKRLNFRRQLQLIKNKTPKFSNKNIFDKNLDSIQLINKNECTFVEQKNKLIKIKLKYLKNLKINPTVNTKTIQTKNLQRAKIIPQVGSLKKINYHSQNNIIKGNVSTRNYTQIPWQQRITARGGQQFEKLKQLLKKQQDEPVYLIFDKQRATRNASENKNRNQNFYKINIANNI